MWAIRLFSGLPLFIHHGLSDVLYFLLYKVGRYRVKIVQSNLQKCFPEKSKEARKTIEKQFYRNFFDFVFLTLRILAMDRPDVRRHMKIINPEMLANYRKEYSVIMMAGHFFPWELVGVAIDEVFGGQAIYSYQKLNSAFFGKLMEGIRGRYGAKGVLRHETAKTIIRERKSKTLFYVLGDQAPVGVAKRYWTRLMGRETAFYHGMGHVAKITGLPVVFIYPIRVKRDQYELHFSNIALPGEEISAEELLDRYVKELERVLRINPENWLWTHKRWKTQFREGDVKKEEYNEK